ncbi:helix-turn-helix transcriptional regulator [Paenibacillus sp. SYP-B4298]|uniref:helix-turn-helix transcriptional regulator n=1 Tax=Paenibacillus sp. SYP-B4298 TaxID=2996034 RepID=UPI0022DD36A5|nr:YafY family protein [Paenibacillus sp. SYP-B4298]
MNKRQMAIMAIMDSRTKFTARELAERFHVSVRTIQRDLDSLQEIGFPLYAELGAHGGYRVLKNRILPPLQLTQHEALGLFLMLQVLENISDFPFSSIRAHLSDHYLASLPADVKDTVGALRDYVVFLQQQATPPSPCTTEVLQAAMERKELSFDYAAPSGRKQVRAFPLGLYLEHGLWYMPASNRGRIILYRVDRMERAMISEKQCMELPMLREWLDKPESRPGKPVVLEFTSFGARLDNSFSLPPEGGQWTGHVPPEELDFLARRLLQYGPHVRVVEPCELRDKVRDLLRQALDHYEDD